MRDCNVIHDLTIQPRWKPRLIDRDSNLKGGIPRHHGMSYLMLTII